jgi:hypothetical protein
MTEKGPKRPAPHLREDPLNSAFRHAGSAAPSPSVARPIAHAEHPTRTYNRRTGRKWSSSSRLLGTRTAHEGEGRRTSCRESRHRGVVPHQLPRRLRSRRRLPAVHVRRHGLQLPQLQRQPPRVALARHVRLRRLGRGVVLREPRPVLRRDVTHVRVEVAHGRLAQ